MLRGLLSDLRYAARTLRRTPGFTFVAVLSLALGAGANTAAYSAMRHVLLAPMPVERPEELALVTWRREGTVRGIQQLNSSSYDDAVSGLQFESNVSGPLYRAMRAAQPRGVDLTAVAFLRSLTLRVGDEPAAVAAAVLADGAYFRTIRPPMALGRALTDADDAPGAPLAVVLSYHTWQRAFGGDSRALGRVVHVNGVSAQVVGVTGAAFRGLSAGGFIPQTDITLPLSSQPRVVPRLSPGRSAFTADDLFWLRVIVRVPEHTSIPAVTGAIAAAVRGTPSPIHDGDGPPASVKLLDGSRGAEPLRGEATRVLYLLGAVTVFVLLIACANLSSLMLARSVSRQRESAVRVALGGSAGRVMRQSMLESVLLGLAGSGAGVLLTLVTRSGLTATLRTALGHPSTAAVDVQVPLDPVVLAISAAIGALAGVLAAALPAIRLRRVDPAAWLAGRGDGGWTPHLRQSRLLVGMQLAITVPLVIGAVMTMRTLANLAAVPLGFRPAGLVVFRVDPEHTGVSESEHPQVYQRVLDQVRAIPGVQSATLMENALLGGMTSNTNMSAGGESRRIYMNAVGPDFAETMGMRVIGGRLPGTGDGPGTALVGAVNETGARALFGTRDPVGQTIRRGRDEVRVIGVVSDARYASRRDSVVPTLYDAALQRPGWGGHHVVVRSHEPIGAIEPAIRQAVSRAHPNLPVPEVRSQLELIAQSSARESMLARALTVFGVLALTLASIGLYGVTAYSVARRTNEFGVRMAVGAAPRHVLWLVLRQALGLGAVGVGVGVPMALAGGGYIRSLLFGIAPTDFGTIAMVAIALIGVVTVAGLVPAWRASRLDVVEAIRRA